MVEGAVALERRVSSFFFLLSPVIAEPVREIQQNLWDGSTMVKKMVKTKELQEWKASRKTILVRIGL